MKLTSLGFSSLTSKQVYVLSSSVQGDYVAFKCDSPFLGTITLVLVNYVTKQVVFTNESQPWVRTSTCWYLTHVCASTCTYE